MLEGNHRKAKHGNMLKCSAQRSCIFLAVLLTTCTSVPSNIQTWGESGSKPGRFSGPTGVAAGPQNNVYVTDWGNHRIQRFPALIRPKT